MAILDIKMPQMNGFKLYGEMQRVDDQVKVCFITAGEMYYDEVRETLGEKEKQYCKIDAAQFLQKPISNLDLVKYSKQNTHAKLDTVSPSWTIIVKDM